VRLGTKYALSLLAFESRGGTPAGSDELGLEFLLEEMVHVGEMLGRVAFRLALYLS
jgi:hypothetical protein